MIYKFDEIIGDLPVGGKAKGLALLHQHAFTIPPFFVITFEGRESFFESPESHYSWMSDGNKAVRSSGMREDGGNQSFAGQFESYLNLNGADKIAQAVKDCIASGEADRVKSYDLDASVRNEIDGRI